MSTEATRIACKDCPNHRVINDKDPVDWFNDDDCAVVCSKVKNDEKKPDGKRPSDRSEFKVVSSMLRPYEVKTAMQPDWCPLLISPNIPKQEVQDGGAKS